MLYRTPRFSALATVRAALARVGGALADIGRSNTDTAYLDSLNDNDLRDLGVKRVNERGETVYR
jgi:hypothetical protein